MLRGAQLALTQDPHLAVISSRCPLPEGGGPDQRVPDTGPDVGQGLDKFVEQVEKTWQVAESPAPPPLLFLAPLPL